MTVRRLCRSRTNKNRNFSWPRFRADYALYSTRCCCWRKEAMAGLRPDEKAVFLQAIELPSTEQRAAFLEAAGGSDLHLRARVEALLRAHEQPQGLLDAPDAGSPTRSVRRALPPRRSSRRPRRGSSGRTSSSAKRSRGRWTTAAASPSRTRAPRAWSPRCRRPEQSFIAGKRSTRSTRAPPGSCTGTSQHRAT